MLDYANLDGVVKAFSEHYKLKTIISNNGILLEDEDDKTKIKQSILEMLGIIVEYYFNKSKRNNNIYGKNVVEFSDIQKIIFAELGQWIRDELDTFDERKIMFYVLQISKVLDFIFKHFASLLKSIKVAFSENEKGQILISSIVYKIDIILFFTLLIPELKSEFGDVLIDENMITKFIQILKINENEYYKITSTCKNKIIFINLGKHYICYYKSKELERGSSMELLKCTKGIESIMGFISGSPLLASCFGSMLLLNILRLLRPLIEPVKPELLTEVPIILRSRPMTPVKSSPAKSSPSK